MATIKSYQEQVQEIVAKAIDTVQTKHKDLAEASFTYAEKLTKLETAKAKHDEFAGIAYDKAREANQYVADFASEMIEKYLGAEEAPVAKKPAAKKTAAKKPAAKKAAAKKEEAAA